MKLIYTSEAKDENEATPLGNGHIGLWAYHRAKEEIIHLNEGTFWTGRPRYECEKDFYTRFLKIRKDILNDKIGRAERTFLARKHNSNSEAYQPIGNLLFTTSDELKQSELDLQKSLLTVKCKNGTREYFVSHPSNVFVLSAEFMQPTTVSLSFKSPHPMQEGEQCECKYYIGNAPDRYLPFSYKKHEGMAFCVVLSIETDGVKNGKEYQNVTRFTVYGTIKTGFVSPFISPETDGQRLTAEAIKTVLDAKKKGKQKLLSEHIRDYQELFLKNDLTFGQKSEEIYPEKEFYNIKKGKNPSTDLINAYYMFAKYLTISSSRDTSPATTLQGLWNKDTHPAWRSNYTININTQMNYWFPSASNLGECALPLQTLVTTLSRTGENFARDYLACKGFAGCHNTDIWGFAFPVKGLPRYAFFPLSGAWLVATLYDVYRYNQNIEFLQQIYPIVKKCCDFILDYLTENKKGVLVTAPSTSPEHSYVRHHLFRRSMTEASTCDMFICREIFTEVIESTKILNRDTEYAEKVAVTLEKLYKPKENKYNRLEEFSGESVDGEKGHRHFSFLIGAFPFHLIGYYNHNEYMPYIKNSLVYRLKNGSGYTGWSCAWALNLLNKTHLSELQQEYTLRLFRDSTYPNLFDKHPPFQIDGNFGAGRAFLGSVAIIEDDVIEFFPVRTDYNQSGSVTNLCLQGGYQITMTWQDYTPSSLQVFCPTDTVKIRTKDGSVQTVRVTPNALNEITL